jgi:hypothetical protein
MTQQEIYQIWAPVESEWSQWVKPILFAHLPEYGSPASSVDPYAERSVRMPSNDGATALVLDLPGAMAVQMAGLLARQGYRPIPLYNSCPPPKSWLPLNNPHSRSINSPGAGSARRPAVEVQPIIEAIVAMTPLLNAAHLPANAKPAFLLDATRRTAQAGYVSVPGAFDNRSVSLPTDFPSSNFLLSRGVLKVALVNQVAVEPEADLSHTLLRWQRAGIHIAEVTLDPQGGVGKTRPITIGPPPLFKIAWYALMARLGLKPNLLGGFGGVLPESGGIG